MTTTHPSRLLSFDEPALLEAVEQIAEEQNRTLLEVITEALRQWLERQEEQEDLAAIAEAEGDPSVPWDEVKEEMRAARAMRRAG